MSLPEISHRCLSCGAAVRAGARFCPQCGQKMDGAPEASDAPPTLDPESAREWTPPTKEFSAFVGSSEDGAVGSSQDMGAGSPEYGAARATGEAHAGGLTPETRDVSADLRETRETAVEAAPFKAQNVDAPPPKARDVEAPAVEAPAVETTDAAVAEGASGEEARGRVARVREGTRVRVGKMRDEALVVFEEAPDDSGLRFVLTAAALFVLFLVILLLSTTALR